jgi:hypothetical protein
LTDDGFPENRDEPLRLLSLHEGVLDLEGQVLPGGIKILARASLQDRRPGMGPPGEFLERHRQDGALDLLGHSERPGRRPVQQAVDRGVQAFLC